MSQTKKIEDEKIQPVVSNQSYTAPPKPSRSENDVDEKAPSSQDKSEVDHEAMETLRQLDLNPNDVEPATAEERKATLKRIDIALLPLMCLSVLLQYLDKTSLNYANLLGIQTDLGLHNQQYSWLGSIFYIGYLASSPVHGFFFQKVRLSRYLGFCILLWGATLALHAACFNYAGLVTCRLFLGIFEAALTPGFILLTGRFYRSREQVARTALWFGQNGTAQILGGAISYGVQLRKPSSLRVWQQLYIILGCLTFAYGFIILFIMPEKPETTRLLSKRQRIVAIERIQENKTGLHDKRFKKEQLIESVKDIRLYLFFLAVSSSNIANGVSSNYSSAILKGLGFDSKMTALVGMSTGAAEIVAIAIGVLMTYYTKTRVIPGVICFLIAIVGGAMLIGVQDKVTQLAGYNLVFFFPVASPLLYSWLSSAIGGTTKKIIFNVVLQVEYCVGNIIGPQTALQREAPEFRTGKITMIAMFVVSAICLTAIGLVHLVWNRRRDQEGEGAEDAKLSELADYTDKQLRSFRYPY